MHISRIEAEANIRGPAIIREDRRIRPNIFACPYTSFHEHHSVRSVGIESGIVMKKTTVESSKRITDSTIGVHNIILNAIDSPRAHKMVVVERSLCSYLKTLESGFGVDLSSHTEASKKPRN